MPIRPKRLLGMKRTLKQVEKLAPKKEELPERKAAEKRTSEPPKEAPRTLTPETKVSPKFRRLPGHIVVDAKAGTGKTFTGVEGVKRALTGQPTPGIRGTEQQETIWAEMMRGPRPGSVVMTAFNKAIAEELQRRVPNGCTASTLHSYGYRLLKQAGFKAKIEDRKTQWLLEKLLDMDIREIRRTYIGWPSYVERLVELCKMNVCEVTSQNVEKTILELSAHYGLELDPYPEMTQANLPKLMEQAAERTDIIDFADMIWLPVVSLPGWKQVDLMVVDEAQDLNKAQQQLVLKSARRLVLVGDVRQAIYGFAGADCDSLPRMTELLSKHPLGCTVLPLTQTWRCGKSIVRMAQELVPEIEAADQNGEGEVLHIEEPEMMKLLQLHDFILCRTNAPLISYAMRLLRMRKPVRIQGREFGRELIDLVKRLANATDSEGKRQIADMLYLLDDYYVEQMERLQRRKFNSEAMQIALTDKVQSIKALLEDSGSVEETIRDIETLFDDSRTDCILFSSIHRAKGLEANRVFFLKHDTCPHPMAKTDWQRAQEWNLRYVALTRAKNVLVLVKSEEKKPNADQQAGEKETAAT